MSEHPRILNELEPTIITGALENWLTAEVTSSSLGRNAVLDDWDTFQRDIALPFEDNSNQNSAKAKSHYSRLDQWTCATRNYDDLLSDDEYLARQLFCAQMFISGAYRQQSFLQANSAEDYLTRRFGQSPTGINMLGTVAIHLDSLGDDELSSGEDLLEATLETNDAALENAQYIARHAQEDQGEESSASVGATKVSQEMWTKLAVRYIAFAAIDRDSIEAVPFWEPKSISEDPQVYYPFESTHSTLSR